MRLGIFVFFDASGKADAYIEYLLESMRSILQKLVIIVNGNIRREDYQTLGKYAQNIFIRENTGYDAGGYKDAITDFLTDEDWDKWDEIVLFNDTFYGPVCPWDKVFEKMDKEAVDFWGLSRCWGGKFPTGEYFTEHIQGYFLVCKRRLICSQFWKSFWENLEYPKTFRMAIENFEIHFSEYFSQKGFSNKAVTDCISIAFDKNPYLDYPYEMMKYADVPVVKRKTFLFSGFEEIQKTLEYIENHTDYDTEFIFSHLWRLQEEGRVNLLPPFNLAHLEQFYFGHDKVFIYGCGKYGKYLEKYFLYKGWEVKGFLVSQGVSCEESVFIYKNMRFDEGDGIILALGMKAFGEVYPTVKDELLPNQLFIPQYRENV